MFAEQVFDPEGITESGLSLVCASTLRSLQDRHSRDHPNRWWRSAYHRLLAWIPSGWCGRHRQSVTSLLCQERRSSVIRGKLHNRQRSLRCYARLGAMMGVPGVIDAQDCAYFQFNCVDCSFDNLSCSLCAEDRSPWSNLPANAKQAAVGVEHEHIDWKTHKAGVNRGTR
jgi:hypothetical protein